MFFFSPLFSFDELVFEIMSFRLDFLTGWYEYVVFSYNGSRYFVVLSYERIDALPTSFPSRAFLLTGIEGDLTSTFAGATAGVPFFYSLGTARLHSTIFPSTSCDLSLKTLFID